MTRRRIRRGICLLCCAALLLQAAPLPAFSAFQDPAVGTVYQQREIPVGETARMTQATLQHSSAGLQHEQYLTFTPSETVRPQAVYGSQLYGTNRVTTIENFLKGKGENVLAAVNGDFFMTDTGVPIGLVVSGGILRSSDNGKPAVGFCADGTTLVGKPGLKVTLMAGGQQTTIDYVNKTRRYYGVYLMNRDFRTTTKTSTQGRSVVLGSVSGSLKIGGSITAQVERIIDGRSDVAIPEGKLVLTAEKGSNQDRIAHLKPGMQVTINIRAQDARWSQVQEAVGGLEVLVAGGTARSGFTAGTAPRTAVGIRADGSCLLYTVDGRQSQYSKGMSLNQLAKRMESLECVEAINLDGGGSTTLAAKLPGERGMAVINRPSDGSVRSCSNFIVLTGSQATGQAAHLQPYPYGITMVKGTTVAYSAKAVDRGYSPAALPGGLSWSCDMGTIDENGRLTADTAGTGVVTVSGENCQGETAVTVVENVDRLTLIDGGTGVQAKARDVTAGAKIDYTIQASLTQCPLYVDDRAAVWSVTGGIGSITADGVFTAGDQPGIGTVTAAVGTKKESVTIRVQGPPQELESFENFTPVTGTNATLTQTADAAYLGSSGGHLTYTLDTGAADLPLERSLAAGGPTHFCLYVRGDGSGNRLEFLGADAQGEELTLCSTPLDFTGWKRLWLAAAGRAQKMTGLRITGSGSGAVQIDQLTAVYATPEQADPPQITGLDGASVSGGVLRLRVVAKADGWPLHGDRVALTVDGTAVSLIAEGNGVFSTEAAVGAGIHRVAVTARDAYGVVTRVSRAAGTVSSPAFADSSGHWAATDMEYLYQQGIAQGSVNGQGVRTFSPERPVTRAEFAKMLADFLHAPAAGETRFQDREEIPGWALSGVSAMVSAGVIQGSPGADGLYFRPNDSITRAELITMLGRTLPLERGGSQNFRDQSAIPGYARDHVQTLFNLGIISGYSDGTLRPDSRITRAEAAAFLSRLR